MFVVICFLTECIPLPGVAFCIGLILVFTGVVIRKQVAMLYWDDACWFIMGSLMFAAAFVKTGVDKRVCLMMFRKLAVPNVKWITLIFFIIIAPLAAFISDHALAAMFLPIGMLLYQNSLTNEIPEDPELGKMLMIAIAMACNIGGHGRTVGRRPQRDHDDLSERHVRNGHRLFSVGHLLLPFRPRYDSRHLVYGQLAV